MGTTSSLEYAMQLSWHILQYASAYFFVIPFQSFYFVRDGKTSQAKERLLIEILVVVVFSSSPWRAERLERKGINQPFTEHTQSWWHHHLLLVCIPAYSPVIPSSPMDVNISSNSLVNYPMPGMTIPNSGGLVKNKIQS